MKRLAKVKINNKEYQSCYGGFIGEVCERYIYTKKTAIKLLPKYKEAIEKYNQDNLENFTDKPTIDDFNLIFYHKLEII